MRWLAVIPVLAALCGCQLGYYRQAIGGHWSLMAKREPVEEVLADPATPDSLAGQLRFSQQVLRYAGDHLDLPADHVYQQYVPLQREAVVWNVLAAPRYSLTPKTWCYLMVGCVSYRGYFHRQAAEQQAARLAEQGLDTWVGGAIAYSTLGWFDDPLTTPMLDRSEPALAELLIHELVHRKLYIKNDTRFNESLATLVARLGAQAYVTETGMALPADYWARRDAVHQAFLMLVRGARDQLAALYASGLPEAQMAGRKAAIQQQLRDDFAARRRQLPALKAYQAFFDGPLNNAQLNGVSDYNGWVPAFRALWQQCQGQWPLFWQQVETLAAQPAEARRARLQGLITEHDE
ncbi:hypothetical protein A11A3_12008 [Alcanivorax hongdengensis A-11-3]|uniref:Aminopeptidase n=1 Tax=Alcanivorax hongdengensis A-11-3 TaxID=1177179 RepID=L0WCG7_9GAMM|nr:aminopeptidase [Alcanivorax hongdengensis]EKF73802.1 hypothetical protein A11A3_12008 [Alcanivorax hongdengensis A-11-3]